HGRQGRRPYRPLPLPKSFPWSGWTAANHCPSCNLPQSRKRLRSPRSALQSSRPWVPPKSSSSQTSPFVFCYFHSTPQGLGAVSRLIFGIRVGARRIARRQHQTDADKRQRKVGSFGIGDFGERSPRIQWRDQAAIERRAVRQTIGLPASEVTRLGCKR